MTRRSEEIQIPAKESSATETTPLSPSNEQCGKQGRERKDETSVFADARAQAAR